MNAPARRDPLSRFVDSMPVRYRQQPFDGTALREHAAIVERRDGKPAHVEIWRRMARGGAAVCVVADDRPGLLSFISASLVVNGLDVEAAQAYTRSEAREAVDFFWLRRQLAVTTPILDADIHRVADTLRTLVTGTKTLDEVVASARAAPRAEAGITTSVRFDGTDAGLTALTVETTDRPGLLLAITRALFRARVQVVASEAQTREGKVLDRFTLVELDGAPLRPNRRGLLQIEVLAAIDSLRAHGDD